MGYKILRKCIRFIDISHWTTQRFMALMWITLFYYSFRYENLDILVISLFILCSHFLIGLSIFMHDYIHDNSLYIYTISFIKISILFFLKITFLSFI